MVGPGAAPRQAGGVGAGVAVIGVAVGDGAAAPPPLGAAAPPPLGVLLFVAVVGVVGVGRGLGHVVLPLRLAQQLLLEVDVHAVHTVHAVFTVHTYIHEVQRVHDQYRYLVHRKYRINRTTVV